MADTLPLRCSRVYPIYQDGGRAPAVLGGCIVAGVLAAVVLGLPADGPYALPASAQPAARLAAYILLAAALVVGVLVLESRRRRERYAHVGICQDGLVVRDLSGRERFIHSDSIEGVEEREVQEWPGGLSHRLLGIVRVSGGGKREVLLAAAGEITAQMRALESDVRRLADRAQSVPFRPIVLEPEMPGATPADVPPQTHTASPRTVSHPALPSVCNPIYAIYYNTGPEVPAAVCGAMVALGSIAWVLHAGDHGGGAAELGLLWSVQAFVALAVLSITIVGLLAGYVRYVRMRGYNAVVGFMNTGLVVQNWLGAQNHVPYKTMAYLDRYMPHDEQRQVLKLVQRIGDWEEYYIVGVSRYPIAVEMAAIRDEIVRRAGLGPVDVTRPLGNAPAGHDLAIKLNRWGRQGSRS